MSLPVQRDQRGALPIIIFSTGDVFSSHLKKPAEPNNICLWGHTKVDSHALRFTIRDIFRTVRIVVS